MQNAIENCSEEITVGEGSRCQCEIHNKRTFTAKL